MSSPKPLPLLTILLLGAITTQVVLSQTSERDFVCAGNGFFADPYDCRKYYLCFLGSVYSYTCDGSKGFDEIVGDCTATACESKTTTPPPSVTCNGFGEAHTDQRDCTRYYVCYYGIPYSVACGNLLAYNETSQRCERGIFESCLESMIAQEATPTATTTDHTTQGGHIASDTTQPPESTTTTQMPPETKTTKQIVPAITARTKAVAEGTTGADMLTETTANEMITETTTASPRATTERQKTDVPTIPGNPVPTSAYVCSYEVASGDSVYCQLYYVCVWGLWFRQKCPTGTGFNNNTRACTQDGCSYGSTFILPTCSNGYGAEADPSSCLSFYYCDLFTRERVNCDPYTAFNVDTGGCDEAAYKPCIDSLISTIPTAPSTTPQSTASDTTLQPAECGDVLVDLVFVVDVSGSIDYSEFNSMITFMKEIVGVLPVAGDQARIGAISFSNNVNLEFALNDFTDQAGVASGLDAISSTNGGTDTAAALNFLPTAFDPTNGNRLGVPDVVVVLTDGESNSKAATLTAVANIASENYITFSIGIGSNVRQSELDAISSDPDSMFSLNADFKSLDTILDTLIETACRDSRYFVCSDGVIIKPDTTDCLLYYVCVWGMWYSQKCPTGTGFNPTTLACSLDGCSYSRVTPLPHTCSRQYGTEADPSSCLNFYQCSGWTPQRRNCDPNTAFNVDTGGCEEAAYQSCIDSLISTTPTLPSTTPQSTASDTTLQPVCSRTEAGFSQYIDDPQKFCYCRSGELGLDCREYTCDPGTQYYPIFHICVPLGKR